MSTVWGRSDSYVITVMVSPRGPLEWEKWGGGGKGGGERGNRCSRRLTSVHWSVSERGNQ